MEGAVLGVYEVAVGVPVVAGARVGDGVGGLGHVVFLAAELRYPHDVAAEPGVTYVAEHGLYIGCAAQAGAAGGETRATIRTVPASALNARCCFRLTHGRFEVPFGAFWRVGAP